jgi:hypothetical protein
MSGLGVALPLPFAGNKPGETEEAFQWPIRVNDRQNQQGTKGGDQQGGGQQKPGRQTQNPGQERTRFTGGYARMLALRRNTFDAATRLRARDPLGAWWPASLDQHAGWLSLVNQRHGFLSFRCGVGELAQRIGTDGRG